MFKVIHFLEGRPKPESANGVVKAVYFLTKYEKKFHKVEIWCISSKVNKRQEIYLSNGVKCIILGKLKNFYKDFMGEIRRVKSENNKLLFHLHGVFNRYNYAAATLLKLNKIPYIVSPHGAIHRNALKIKSYKKLSVFVLNWFYLSNASAIRFISMVEDEFVGFPYNFILGKEKFVVKNGVEFKSEKIVECREEIFYNKLFEFIGRISVNNKGIDLMYNVIKKMPDTNWRIIGPDEDGFFSNMKKIPSNLLVIPQKVLGEKKYNFLRKAFFFVHPSRYEVGLPLSVLEALSEGIPVITSTFVDPKRELEKYGAGFVIEPKEIELEGIVRKILNISFNEWCMMKKNAFDFVRNNYKWDNIAARIHNEYRKVLDVT